MALTSRAYEAPTSDRRIEAVKSVVCDVVRQAHWADVGFSKVQRFFELNEANVVVNGFGVPARMDNKALDGARFEVFESGGAEVVRVESEAKPRFGLTVKMSKLGKCVNTT